jgi:hypothetical protein
VSGQRIIGPSTVKSEAEPVAQTTTP